MHSLKNTIVAVGLLGLSFLFYQASSNKSPVTDDMIPALEISDGAVGAPMEVGPNAGVLPPLDMPKTDTPELIQPETSPPALVSNSGISSPKESTRDFSFGGAPDGSSAQPNTNSLSNAARDAGLINVLESQQTTEQNRGSGTTPPINNNLTSTPDKSTNPSFNAKIQPEIDADLSFNAQASVDSDDRNSEVVRAGTESLPINTSLQAVWPTVKNLIDQEEYQEALVLLSGYYRSGNLNDAQRKHLLPWLDGLATKVIFSSEHHLEGMPYTVANETLADIGETWKVPAELVYNVNREQISNPDKIPSGTQLKAVRGPFDAEIDLNKNEMTLFLGNLYAGRFLIRVGISGNPQPGEFRVLIKSESGHTWRDAEGNDYPPGAPENGYGPHWIGLSGHLCIHAVDETATTDHHGCIGLSEQDAIDVFAILTDGSKVTIVR